MEFIQFQFLVGQTVMYCQIIENDIKLIYALLKNGDFKANLEEIKTTTLGKTIYELEELDNSDGRPYISSQDYEYLKKIAGWRNHWCHEAYVNFMYEPDYLHSDKYQRECYMLEKDNMELERVYMSVEKVRLNLYEIRKKTRRR